MTTSKPLISVIMPVYNGGSTIRQAVESVFCQNVPLELLVIDDGSTDETSEVLSAYQDRTDFYYLYPRRHGTLNNNAANVCRLYIRCAAP